MKQITNDNAANRTSYIGYVYNVGEKTYKEQILDSLPKKWSVLHRDGTIHIHDLDAYDLTYNCLTLDIVNDFPYEDFKQYSDSGKIIHLFELIKEIITKLGNEQSGGIAFANFDNEVATVMTKLSINYAQHLELIENMIAEFILWTNNNHSRMGQTSYYVTLNIGLAKSEFAKYIAKTLITKFRDLGPKVIKPNIVFKVVEGVNASIGNPNYDLFLLALQTTEKKMIPTYLLCDSQSDKNIDPEVLSVMGCRTRVVDNLFGEKGALGRGNIANISINLPRLALEVVAKYPSNSIEERINEFYLIWDDVASKVKDILIDRYSKVCSRTSEDFPTNSLYHLWRGDFHNATNLETVFKHGTLSIGFIGLSEAIELLTEKKYYLSLDNYVRALGFVKHMRDYCDFLRKEYNLNFSLLATSGEYISGRFIEIDKTKFQIDSAIFAKGYYTNSFHVDVDSQLPGYRKIQIEGMFHEFCNGGSITYIEMGEAPLGNDEGLREYIDIAIKAGVRYLGFNFPKDVCDDCGSTGVFDSCPNCGSNNITRIRRVSGYLEILDGFTRGKKAEVKNRKSN